MRTRETTVAVYADGLGEKVPGASSAHIATIISLQPDGTPEVRVGTGTQLVAARLAVRVSRERLEAAIAGQQPAVVLFEGGDRSKPIIVGFIETVDRAAAAPVTSPETADGSPLIEADVDGRRLRVTAQDEIVLQCGQASITLRRNGRVIVRGTYVETHSEGTNRIKGGQVQIN